MEPRWPKRATKATFVPFFTPFFHYLTELGSSHEHETYLFEILLSKRLLMTLDGENWGTPSLIYKGTFGFLFLPT